MTASLSIVIPTYNSRAVLPRTASALKNTEGGSLIHEVIVVDGGSKDGTREVAETLGAKVIEAPASRGGQLSVGGAQATAEWFLFLHADTRLDAAWHQIVAAFIEDPANRDHAAVFRFALDDPDPRARRVERITHWRNRVLGLPYGDQGLLISRDFYKQLGGFRPFPLMEDVDLVRRIGRRRICCLPATATTSAVRYRRDGWWLRPIRNVALLALFSLGTPPRLLTRLY
ncbi:TIGR04283 family arsenosugar biosynthesis glycosyltransferase [Denitrobaculum tricleocarpae]|uniref:Glycosyltransferase n=1 Tax=Denitrobaculum tricleocarpae TaxID=2591009 RepID=A0A545U201_9PROT|nr:TIGR04283 family arsenosugar biosynthesis glycosyltransferase [Denitrobaculum tricleocarpae]TQV83507.1 glycosyltransferase [Denitrobaculum tricleocarpae]